MGLDMYLYLEKRHYESKYNNKDITYPAELKPFEDEIEKSISTNTCYQVGYWRKANAIHRWVVENCAEGVDDCQPIYLNIDQINDLIDCCKHILKRDVEPDDVLPTIDGFFFGSTDYDDWYYQDVQYTLDIFTKVRDFIKADKEEAAKSNDFYRDEWRVLYNASW